MKRSSIPEGRRLIGSKWVFKEKREGRFRARLVCLGYSQIPGVDFSDNYAPFLGQDYVINCHRIVLDNINFMMRLRSATLGHTKV